MNQKAESGNGSPIIQVAGDYYSGIDETKAKEIALATVRTEFSILYAEAKDVFEKRTHKIINDSLDKIQQTDPLLLQRFKEPAIQITLNSIYKEYAKTGDESIAEDLVDLLIDRLSASERSTQQVIIDDAITTIPKLNSDHIKFLASYYGLRYHRSLSGIYNLNSYNKFINININNYPEIQIINEDFILYLKYIGCVIDFPMTKYFRDIQSEFNDFYKGLFNKGFLFDDIPDDIRNEAIQNKLMIKCQQNILLAQINALNDATLNSVLDEINQEYKEAILNLYNNNTMSNQEIAEYHNKLNPRCIDVFKSLNSDNIHSLQLTNLGLYLGRKYITRLLNTINISSPI